MAEHVTNSRQKKQLIEDLGPIYEHGPHGLVLCKTTMERWRAIESEGNSDDALAVRNSRDLMKAVARDIGKEVAHHIETMYPDAVKAASSTFLVSVRGCTYNAIMAWLEIDGQDTAQHLSFNERFRRHIRGQYKKIRREPNG